MGTRTLDYLIVVLQARADAGEALFYDGFVIPAEGTAPRGRGRDHRLHSPVVLTDAHPHGRDITEYITGVRNAFAT